VHKKINQRVGILGGTFDPIHEGHLIIAENAIQTLTLDHVELIPCFQPPHRQAIASAVDRLAMVKLAIKNHAKLIVNDVEIKRKGISYTIDTLRELKKISPATEFFYIIGADAFSQFDTWKSPQEILTLATLVVVNRETEKNKTHSTTFDDQVMHLPITPIPYAASDIRAQLQSKEKKIAGLPTIVLEFIQKNQLYR